ncbi:MAG: rRNA adenine N-6-methyltransferase family protein [bacterium]
MYLIIAFVVFLFIIVILFSFPQFSPIPYFPSNIKDLPLILDALSTHNNQTVIDLGAGDGIVILKAAEKAYQNKLNTQFIAVEINPVLLLVLYTRCFFHPNRKNIQIVNTNMFSMDYSSLVTSHHSLITFYIYISPWFIEKTVANITKQMETFNLVSYFYQVKCLQKYKEGIKEGVHKIYKYTNDKIQITNNKSGINYKSQKI